MEIIIQEYSIGVSGPGVFTIKTDNFKNTMAPTFGFKEDGTVGNRKYGKEHGYAPLKREWIDENINNIVKAFVDDYNKEYIMPTSQWDNISVKEVNKGKCDKVYVFLFSRSDCPNEIGIMVDDSPFIVEDSSIVFKEGCIV